jgi:hypothetical protein
VASTTSGTIAIIIMMIIIIPLISLEPSLRPPSRQMTRMGLPPRHLSTGGHCRQGLAAAAAAAAAGIGDPGGRRGGRREAVLPRLVVRGEDLGLCEESRRAVGGGGGG